MDQAKAFLGAVKFELRTKAELTSDEAEIVKEYQADNEVLVNKEVKVPFTGRGLELDIKIENLIVGKTFKCADLADILEAEKNVTEAAERFKNYIEVMKNFGGQQVIEYK